MVNGRCGTMATSGVDAIEPLSKQASFHAAASSDDLPLLVGPMIATNEPAFSVSESAGKTDVGTSTRSSEL